MATIANHQYQYNDSGQINQIVEPTITKSYGYDAVDRLTSATYANPPQPNESYAYDRVGNRIASQLSASYTYQRFNRLTSTATASYSFPSNARQHTDNLRYARLSDLVLTVDRCWTFDARGNNLITADNALSGTPKRKVARWNRAGGTTLLSGLVDFRSDFFRKKVYLDRPTPHY